MNNAAVTVDWEIQHSGALKKKRREEGERAEREKTVNHKYLKMQQLVKCSCLKQVIMGELHSLLKHNQPVTLLQRSHQRWSNRPAVSESDCTHSAFIANWDRVNAGKRAAIKLINGKVYSQFCQQHAHFHQAALFPKNIKIQTIPFLITITVYSFLLL